MFNGCVVLPCTFKSSERIPFFSHDLPICAKSLQSCPTLCNPINYSPPGSSVHGILQVRILGWVAMPSSGDLSHPGMEPVSLMSPTLAGRFFTTSTTQEAPDISVSILISQLELQAQEVKTFTRDHTQTLGLTSGSSDKESAWKAGDVGDTGSTPGSGRSRKDPLEKEVTTHSSILVWEVPWAEVPGGPQSMESQWDTARQLIQTHKCEAQLLLQDKG